ncbi:MAG: beta-ketoacyl synthase N-terminal-like domain-containing protein [Limisphaerales bacterium]
MSAIYVQGIGAVSPAGWGVPAFRDALAKGEPLAEKDLPRPGFEKPLRFRQVPAPQPRPAFLANARLRRISPISQYATAAALEALGSDLDAIKAGQIKLGIVLTVMSGCVNYSRRFYDETLRDPSTASPLVFPETVFNAPASHIASLLGTNAINYTIVGDPGTYLQGLALATDWISTGHVDRCLVIGAEEMDWLGADAYRLFQPKLVLGDGAGAVYLGKEPTGVQLTAITSPHLFLQTQNRHCAALKMRIELSIPCHNTLLCDSTQNHLKLDAAENAAWYDWTGHRLSVKNVMGEGLMAAAAWQCVAAVDAIQTQQASAANVSVVGCNQHAIGAQFRSFPQQ